MQLVSARWLAIQTMSIAICLTVFWARMSILYTIKVNILAFFLLSGSDTGVQFIVILTSPVEGLFQLMTTNHDRHFLVSLVSWETSGESTSFYTRALENKSDGIRQQMKSYMEVTKIPTCSQMDRIMWSLGFCNESSQVDYLNKRLKVIVSSKNIVVSSL